jgi:glycosidase
MIRTLFGRFLFLSITYLIIPVLVYSQADSVDVTFYYTPPANHTYVFLPGEFNNWGPNSNGVIQPGAPSQMEFDEETGRWYKTVRLRVGGHVGGGVNGAYQYKINREGTSGGWIQDPLNPRENPLDHNNSILYVNDPTIFHLLPNSAGGIVETRTPTIKAYLYPSTNTTVNPQSIQIEIDGNVYDDLGDNYDENTHLFSFQIPQPLASGTYALKLTASTSDGSVSSDSTEFTVEAGFIRLLTRPNNRHLRETIKVDGTVADDSIGEVIFYHNDDPVNVSVDGGFFSYEATLTYGKNIFYAVVDDPEIKDNQSDPVTIVYFIDIRPRPRITGYTDEAQIVLEIDELNPDPALFPWGLMTVYQWTSDDPLNPSPLPIQGAYGNSISFPIPDVPGEYYIDVLAERVAIIDIGGEYSFGFMNTAEDEPIWWGNARTYVRVHEDGTATIATVEGNPSWVQDAIVYEIYIPAFASGGAGTFQHVINRLPEIKDLGVNVIWFMPLYDNNEGINELNAGYNIADFYSVHPQLGTMEKFDELVATAQEMGIRIILDSTPNHIGGLHPWLDDLRQYRDYSIYRPIVENRLLGSPRDLGHSIVYADDNYPLYARYSNWTLPNLNYHNIETIDYMLEMYTWWLLERNIDGYRMDVYWGPVNRYGTEAWWTPFREEIKRVRPEAFILSETDGTGSGSEINYADFGGASDAAYDWNLYGYIKNVLSGSGSGNITDLHNRVINFAPAGQPYNYFTGEHSHLFRFVENHDETRIAQLYGIAKAKAGAVLTLTIPGIPLIYAGQEVGETSRRGTISWTRSGAEEMRNFFKRLTYSRNEFPAFTTPDIIRVLTGNSRVYSFTRPFDDQNAIVAINFSAGTASATLQINNDVLSFTEGGIDDEKSYYLNDVLNDSSATVTGTDLAAYTITLGPWESAVYVLSDTLIRLVTHIGDDTGKRVPEDFTLRQNYPNPFNPGTTIVYSIPKAAQVTLNVYDVLGRRVATLVDEFQNAGSYQRYFDASHLSSGIYYYRIEAGGFVDVKKMMYVR